MSESSPKVSTPKVIAWETTIACPLACLHCRAEACPHPDPLQLTTDEGKSLLSQIAELNPRAIVILTGGEPLTRPDIFDLAAHGTSLGLYMTTSPDDGRLLTSETVQRLKDAGIQRISFSLHYPDSAENDYFARTEGAFDAAMRGLANLRVGGLPFQINTTVTRRNADRLPRMYELVRQVGAVSWDLFFLIPTGRARMMGSDEMPPDQYEAVLNWLYDLQMTSPIPVKQTCAPHFRRIERQRQKAGGAEEAAPAPAGHRLGSNLPIEHSRRHGATSRGCMTGDGFIFISHVGDVCGCGYLPIKVGNLRESSFREIYYGSRVFDDLRDVTRLGGKCGVCEYRAVCGGCRARAYAQDGDYLAEEPYCSYEPLTAQKAGA